MRKTLYQLFFATVTSAEFLQIGSGDCDDFDEVNNGTFEFGIDCMQSCYDQGYFLVSWNGNCYCEENPEGDECNNYT